MAADRGQTGFPQTVGLAHGSTHVTRYAVAPRHPHAVGLDGPVTLILSVVKFNSNEGAPFPGLT